MSNEDLFKLADNISKQCSTKILENFKNLELQTNELLIQCMDNEKLHLELNLKHLKSNFYHLRDESKTIANNCQNLSKLQNQIKDKIVNINEIIQATQKYYETEYCLQTSSSHKIKQIEKDLTLCLAQIERIQNYEEFNNLSETSASLPGNSIAGVEIDKIRQNIDENVLNIKELMEISKIKLVEIEDYELTKKVLVDKLLDIENRIEILHSEISLAQVLPDACPDPEYLEEIYDTVIEWKLATDTLKNSATVAENTISKMENLFPASAIVKYSNRLRPVLRLKFYRSVKETLNLV